MDAETRDIENLKIRFQYAWNWFQLHSSQRLAIFNYFLVVVGVLAAAVTAALKERLPEVAVALSLFGCLATVGFYALERRNHRLIKYGELAMRELEPALTVNGLQDMRLLLSDLDDESAKGKLSTLSKHRTWIRMIQAGACIMFAYGAWLGYMTASAPAPLTPTEQSLTTIAESIKRLATSQQDSKRRVPETSSKLRR